MLTLLRNGHVFAPNDIGETDLLVGGGQILAVGRTLPAVPDGLVEWEDIDLGGRRIVPGFIDTHLHFTGGGGNEGFPSRIPDLHLSDLTRAGITTAVGCLGVDQAGKSLLSLLSKARALDEEGLTTYIYAGSFVFGEPTITGDLRIDIPLVDKMLGIKIALSESRGSHPTVIELARLASDAYTGGLLAGKPGCLNIHLGLKPEDPYALLADVLDHSGVPPDRFVPTHVNYSERLLAGAIEFAHFGTYLNVDSILTPSRGVLTAVEPHQAILRLLEAGVPIDRIGMSTDGNASVPRFATDHRSRGPYRLGFDTLIAELQHLVASGLDLATALKPITSTPARMLRLDTCKGQIAPGMDADLVVLDEQLNVCDVYAKGRRLVSDGEPVVVGMYENEETRPTQRVLAAETKH